MSGARLLRSSNGNNHNRNRRSAVIKNRNTHHQISGHKRNKPDSNSDNDGSSYSSNDDDEDASSNESSSSNNRNNHNNAHSNNNNHNNNISIPSLESLPTQNHRHKRRKITFQKATKKKWENKPNQKLRRSTRIKYRKLAEKTQSDRAQIVDPMQSQFIDNLNEQQNIYTNVCHPQEAFMDITQTNNMSKILKEQTRSLANEQFTITPTDYIRAILDNFGLQQNDSQNSNAESDDDEPQKVDWSAIGHKFAGWFLTVPPISFMNGPLQHCHIQTEEPKKKRQPRKKKNFNTNKPQIQPEKVVKQKKSDKTETKSRVAALKKTLKRKCMDGGINNQRGANMFEFLVNPHSYSQTIENLFDMSFITKEGFCQMDVDEATQQPVLSYVSRKERTKRHNAGHGGKTNGQCIVKFNPSTFCNLINVYGITESQIEREEVESDSESDGDDESMLFLLICCWNKSFFCLFVY